MLEEKRSLSVGYVPVTAYVGSQRNLQMLKGNKKTHGFGPLSPENRQSKELDAPRSGGKGGGQGLIDCQPRLITVISTCA